MLEVNFFTPIYFAQNSKNVFHSTLEFVDDYFYLGGRKAEVISPMLVDGKYAVTFSESTPSHLMTALKVASYVTIVLPLLFLAIKAILRSTHAFQFKFSHLTEEQIVKLFSTDTDEKRIWSRQALEEISDEELDIVLRAGKNIGPILSDERINKLDLAALTDEQIRSIFPTHLDHFIRESKRQFAMLPLARIGSTLLEGKTVEAALFGGDQFKELKLSELSNQQIADLFPAHSLETLTYSRKKFAFIPNVEIQAAFQAGKLIGPLLSDWHLTIWSISALSNEQIDSLFPMPVEFQPSDKEFLDFPLPLMQTNEMYLNGLNARMEWIRKESKRQFALLSDLEVANIFRAGKVIKPLLSEAQLKNLALSELSETQIEGLFPPLMPNNRERFALISEDEIKAAFKAGKVIGPLLSDEQIKGLQLSQLNSKQIDALFPLFEENKLFDWICNHIFQIPGRFLNAQITLKEVIAEYKKQCLQINKESKRQFALLPQKEVVEAIRAGTISSEKLEKWGYKIPDEATA